MRNVWIFFQTWDSLQSLLQIQSILNVHWRYFSRLTSEAFVVKLNMYAYSLFSRMGSVDVPNLKKKVILWSVWVANLIKLVLLLQIQNYKASVWFSICRFLDKKPGISWMLFAYKYLLLYHWVCESIGCLCYVTCSFLYFLSYPHLHLSSVFLCPYPPPPFISPCLVSNPRLHSHW